MENLTNDKSNLTKMLGVLAILACVYIGAKIITEVKSFKYIGGGAPASNVMTFDGSGEVFAKPDIANISFTIRDDEKDMKTAQTKVTEKESAVLAFLEKSGIEKKDIKTEGYNSYPKYDYRQSVCPPMPMNLRMDSGVSSSPAYYCPPGKQVLTGYEVSETITAKVRDLAKAGDIVKGIGDLGVSDISGPNFAIDNEDSLKEQARKMAIDEAKEKAKKLSKDLGVRLVRIVNFSEGGYAPMMYAGKEMMAMDAVANTVAPSPELPAGENKIVSNVTITYEIR